MNISLAFATQRTAPVMNWWLSTASAIGRFRKSGFSIAYSEKNKVLDKKTKWPKHCLPREKQNCCIRKLSDHVDTRNWENKVLTLKTKINKTYNGYRDIGKGVQ